VFTSHQRIFALLGTTAQFSEVQFLTALLNTALLNTALLNRPAMSAVAAAAAFVCGCCLLRSLQAGVGTNPADVLKVRLQMQNELGAAAGRQAAGPAAAATAAAATAQQPQLGLLQMLKQIVRAEGCAALMYGWQVRWHKAKAAVDL
jgi:hypothetical protein